MNKEKQMEQAEDFIISKINGGWARFQQVEDLPEGATPIKKADIEAMTLEQMGQTYSEIAGVGPKKFSTQEIACASLLYQIHKLLVRNGKTASLSTAKETRKSPQTPGTQAPRASRASGTLEILEPADLAAALSGLAPQAKELMAMLTEVATASRSMSFPASAMAELLAKPEAPARLKTKQPPARIWSYYKATLEDRGLLRCS
jgi:hypothetical protein